MQAPIIKATQLCQRFTTGAEPIEVLRGIDLTIHAGETVALVGASGSGKSTLLGLLAGLDRASSGDVALFGTSLTPLDEEARAAVRALRVAFVFQSFELIESLSALENVALPLELFGRAQATELAREWLTRVGLAARLEHRPARLSGGEQQRVALARAFAIRPQLLFADEPTGSLDRRTAEEIVDLLFALNREAQTTLVLVTHDLTLAARCARRYALIDGQLQAIT